MPKAPKTWPRIVRREQRDGQRPWKQSNRPVGVPAARLLFSSASLSSLPIFYFLPAGWLRQVDQAHHLVVAWVTLFNEPLDTRRAGARNEEHHLFSNVFFRFFSRGLRNTHLHFTGAFEHLTCGNKTAKKQTRLQSLGSLKT